MQRPCKINLSASNNEDKSAKRFYTWCSFYTWCKHRTDPSGIACQVLPVVKQFKHNSHSETSITGTKLISSRRHTGILAMERGIVWHDTLLTCCKVPARYYYAGSLFREANAVRRVAIASQTIWMVILHAHSVRLQLLQLQLQYPHL